MNASHMEIINHGENQLKGNYYNRSRKAYAQDYGFIGPTQAKVQ